MSIEALDLRKGQGVRYKGDIWVCVENTKIAKGKGQSYQSIGLRNAKTGQLIKERFRTTQDFEEVYIERKSMTYLYTDSNSHVVMDNDTYEQIHLPLELIGEQSVYLKEDTMLDVGFAEGEPMTVELPNTVELTVESTPPEVKGATVTNQLKDAVCEGGAKIKVPPFIENGEVVKVDTRTGEYLGRA